MLIPRVGGVEVRSHIGILFIPRALEGLKFTGRGRRIFAAAASPLSAQSEGHRYRLLLERARECTFRHPEGQLHGRQGRRSVLEDGERMLHRCLDQRPDCVEARMLLIENVMAQGRGREAEVPHMVVDALRRTELRSCRRTSRHAQKALGMIRMGFAALTKVYRESGSARFTADVLRLVPDLEGSVYEMAHTKRVLTGNVYAPFRNES
ncbi:g6756 [Coccomyxa viridis]|uniref:G6756 protein n=1 Tax=Coccomyxa viridis TaxID=1274662 RepID=A0ABP1FW45_9CHLO